MQHHCHLPPPPGGSAQCTVHSAQCTGWGRRRPSPEPSLSDPSVGDRDCVRLRDIDGVSVHALDGPANNACAKEQSPRPLVVPQTTCPITSHDALIRQRSPAPVSHCAQAGASALLHRGALVSVAVELLDPAQTAHRCN